MTQQGENVQDRMLEELRDQTLFLKRLLGIQAVLLAITLIALLNVLR